MNKIIRGIPIKKPGNVITGGSFSIEIKIPETTPVTSPLPIQLLPVFVTFILIARYKKNK